MDTQNHNQRVINGLETAVKVAQKLADQGHRIQAICAGNGQPHVWIQPGASVRGLDAYTAKRGRDCSGRYEIRSACRHGIAINWIIRHQRRAAA